MCSPRYAKAILRLFNFRWNHDRAVAAGLYSPEMCHNYSTHLVEDIKEWGGDDNERSFDDFVSTRDYKDTGEEFYDVTAESATLLGGEDDDLVEYDGNGIGGDENGDPEEEEDDEDEETRINQARPRYRLPTQPVINKDEKELFEVRFKDKPRFKLAEHSIESGNSNVDWNCMALEWNRFIRRNHWTNHNSNKILYLKTASHLRDHNSKRARIENSNKTLALPAQNGGGKTNQEVVNSTREQLRTTATSVKPAASTAMITPAPNSIPQVNPIRPPVSTSQIHSTSYQDRMPTFVPVALPSAAPTPSKQQCGRCGESKSGPDHKTRVQKNSVEYCTKFGKLDAMKKAELVTRGFPRPGLLGMNLL